MLFAALRAGIFATLLLVTVGCESDNPTVPIPVDSTVVAVANVRPDSADVLYYSAELGRVVQKSELSTTGWDIHVPYIECCGRTKSIPVKLNLGGSGSGSATMGAVINARFENVKSVPPGTVFRTDATDNPVVPLPVLGPDAFFVYDIASHTLRPSPDKVLLVKTSSGKVYKFQITSIYKDAETNPTQETPIGFYHFRSAQIAQ